jgi:HD-like signal output (HDOD) protein
MRRIAYLLTLAIAASLVGCRTVQNLAVSVTVSPTVHLPAR